MYVCKLLQTYQSGIRTCTAHFRNFPIWNNRKDQRSSIHTYHPLPLLFYISKPFASHQIRQEPCGHQVRILRIGWLGRFASFSRNCDVSDFQEARKGSPAGYFMPAKFHDGIIFCTIVVITDRTRVDNVGCYAVIRLTQKGNPRQMCHSRTKKFDPRKIDYPRKKFHPRKITHAKLSPKRTHDPRKFTHVPRPTQLFQPTQPTQPTQFSTLHANGFHTDDMTERVRCLICFSELVPILLFHRLSRFIHHSNLEMISLSKI